VSAPSPRAVVEHCLAEDGRAPLAAVYDAANLLGIADQPVRLAIRRLVDAGLVEQHGRGRAGELRATPAARLRGVLDGAYWAFAIDQDEGTVTWDGRWHLLAFSVPEARRAERDALRATLAHLGAAPLTPGLYLSPHDLGTALAAEAGPAVHDHLTTARATAVRHAGRPVEELVAELWPLTAVRAGYARFDAAMDRWSAARRPDAGPAQALAGRIAVLAALDAAVGPDPLLPPALLPDDWPGRRSRDRFRRDWAGPGPAS
jgi:phenylacetic acid degradation operon negative regulatory protein